VELYVEGRLSILPVGLFKSTCSNGRDCVVSYVGTCPGWGEWDPRPRKAQSIPKLTGPTSNTLRVIEAGVEDCYSGALVVAACSRGQGWLLEHRLQPMIHLEFPRRNDKS
jgi:hypothetical protein